jgi:hypothetical protein
MNLRRGLSRRQLLKGAGALGLLAPFASNFGGSTARAQASTVPKRLLVVDMPNVVWRSDWLPSSGRDVTAGSGSATDFTYGPQTEFFERIRQHTTLVSGLPTLRPGGDPHVAAQIQFMTGGVIPEAGAETSKYPSIDQVLLQGAPAFSEGLAAPSVTWSAFTQGDGARLHTHVISFDQSLQPIFPQNDPYLAYQSLFAGFTPPDSDDSAAELETIRLQNKSVLDHTLASVERLKSRVGTTEKLRIEAHLEGLHELERRFEGTTMTPTTTATLPDSAALDALQVNTTSDHKKMIQGFFDLTRSAFAFDRTRVGTLMLSSAQNWVTIEEQVAGLVTTGHVHEITHKSYLEKNLDMRLIANFYGTLLADFVESLANTEEADGTSLLDNTLIVFFSEVSITGDGIDASHDVGNTPLAVIGGNAMGHTGGRHLSYTNRSTNDFWATVGKQLGADMTTFGNPEDNSGELAELFA